MQTPKPPISMEPQELHRSLKEVCSFLEEMHRTGNKHAGFTQTQINSMTTNQDLGKIVYNTTTNESNASYLDGTVKWRVV